MADGVLPNWESLVPHPLAPQLLDVLPPTPFQNSRRLQLRGRAQAIQYASETLQERHQRIAARETEEPSEVERRVHDQQYERLHALEQQLAENALQFVTDLRSACATSTNPAACMSLCDTFERLAQTLLSDGVVHLELAQDHLASSLRSLDEVVIGLREEQSVASK